jgi:glycerophosphoryl diester phosphodiesterase
VARRPTVIAHRGASGYEYENSRAAFRRAVMLDADGIELDVHATRDGAIVVHHDEVLPELGPIGRLSLADLRQYRLRSGDSVPLLAEVLDIVGDRDVWVEIKSLAAAFDGALLAVLDAGPAPARYGVHAFDHRIIRRIGLLRPRLRRGVLLASYVLDPVAVLRDVGATTLWQEWHMVDQALVDLVHDAGCGIIAWTVNEIADIQMMARLGVDGICGNYPDRIRVAGSVTPGDTIGSLYGL